MKIKLGMEQEVKTDYKKRTLNPRYDETFDLLVYERSVEVRAPSDLKFSENFLARFFGESRRTSGWVHDPRQADVFLSV